MNSVTQSELDNAVDDALNGSGTGMMNPAVHWSFEDGLTVTPAANLSPLNEGEIELWVANFSANDGSPYNCPDLEDVLDMIN